MHAALLLDTIIDITRAVAWPVAAVGIAQITTRNWGAPPPAEADLTVEDLRQPAETHPNT